MNVYIEADAVPDKPVNDVKFAYVEVRIGEDLYHKWTISLSSRLDVLLSYIVTLLKGSFTGRAGKQA